MATENISNEKPSFAAPPLAVPSCRKKKGESATFLEDVKDHIDEFILASMEEHKTCFQKTINKMFGMSKIVAERSLATKEVESSLPLQTTVAEIDDHDRRRETIKKMKFCKDVRWAVEILSMAMVLQ